MSQPKRCAFNKQYFGEKIQIGFVVVSICRRKILVVIAILFVMIDQFFPCLFAVLRHYSVGKTPFLSELSASNDN